MCPNQMITKGCGKTTATKKNSNCQIPVHMHVELECSCLLVGSKAAVE